MSNIVEYIDALLPQDILPISYLTLPENTDGMLIEETGAIGRIDSFQGFDNVISSNIQFYARISPKSGKYKEIGGLLKQFYKKVQESKGVERDGIRLLWCDTFTLNQNIRDSQNNYIFSMIFNVIYKEE